MNEVVRIFLVSDPDLPAELARRLALELPDLLPQRLAADVEWQMRTMTVPLVGDEQLDITRLVDVVVELMPDEDRMSVCLSPTCLGERDCARRSRGRQQAPTGAGLDPDARRLAGYRNVREAVVGLVAELTVWTSDRTRSFGGVTRCRRNPSRRRTASNAGYGWSEVRCWAPPGWWRGWSVPTSLGGCS